MQPTHHTNRVTPASSLESKDKAKTEKTTVYEGRKYTFGESVKQFGWLKSIYYIFAGFPKFPNPNETTPLKEGDQTHYGTFPASGQSVDKANTVSTSGVLVGAATGAYNYLKAGVINNLSRANNAITSAKFILPEGVTKEGTINNIANISTYSNPKKVRDAADERKYRTIKAAEANNIQTAVIERNTDFSKVQPSSDGICDGVRSGIAKRVLFEGKTAVDAAKDYRTGGDLYAESYQAVGSKVQVLAVKEDAINEHLDHLPPERAANVAYILDHVSTDTNLSEKHKLTGPNPWEPTETKTVKGFFGDKKVVTALPKVLQIPENDRVRINSQGSDPSKSIAYLKTKLTTDKNLSPNQIEDINYAIAFLTVVVKSEQSTTATQHEKVVDQLHSEFINHKVAQYLNIADGIRVSRVKGMETSALSQNNNEFLDKMMELPPGFYGFNIRTTGSPHAMTLNIRNDGKFEIVDPNGIVLLCKDKTAGRDALRKIISSYSPPGEGSVNAGLRETLMLGKNVTENDNHQISILKYDKMPNFKPVSINLDDERKKDADAARMAEEKAARSASIRAAGEAVAARHRKRQEEEGR